ncbi:caspase-6-like [Styela clava]
MDKAQHNDIDPQTKDEESCDTQTDALPSLTTILGKKKVNGGKSKHHNFADKLLKYKMDYPNTSERGHVVIINNENFHWTTGMNSRKGTDADANNLSRLFNKLDFKVGVYRDQTTTDMMEIVKQMADKDHKDYDCFIMVLLSHGDDGKIYGTDGLVEIKKIVDSFRGESCPSLAGKPKIFLFQACRGTKHEVPIKPSGDTVDSADVVDSKKQNETVVDAAVKATIPSGSDFLFCYSVAEGFYSHRDTLYGSWYVQAFVEVFEEELINKGKDNAEKMDVLDLLTLVNYKVSLRSVERTRNPDAIGKKQMPCFLSMLTKKLFLTPKK